MARRSEAGRLPLRQHGFDVMGGAVCQQGDEKPGRLSTGSAPDTEEGGSIHAARAKLAMLLAADLIAGRLPDVAALREGFAPDPAALG